HGVMLARLVFVLSVLTTASGCGCPDVPYTRIYDLATHCHDTGACEVPAGVSVVPGSGGDDEFAMGTFELWPDQSISVPVAGFREQIASKPKLAVALRAGAPLVRKAVQVTFDQVPASCAPEPSIVSDDLLSSCVVPADVAQIAFVYAGRGLGEGTGWAR